jgi:hypothetical protein
MYFNRSGLVAENFNIVRKRGSWGSHQLVFTSPVLTKRFRVLALTFTEVFLIHKGKLDEVLAELPNEWEKIRLTTLRLLFRAAVNYVCRMERKKIRQKKAKDGFGRQRTSIMDAVAKINLEAAAAAQRESREMDEEEEDVRVRWEYPGPTDDRTSQILALVRQISEQNNEKMERLSADINQKVADLTDQMIRLESECLNLTMRV